MKKLIFVFAALTFFASTAFSQHLGSSYYGKVKTTWKIVTMKTTNESSFNLSFGVTGDTLFVTFGNADSVASTGDTATYLLRFPPGVTVLQNRTYNKIWMKAEADSCQVTINKY